jgi:hypothetical protein
MPLPAMRTAKRCSARAKSTGIQCQNPAAYGTPVCRFHGARKRSTVLTGQAHPNYQHGRATKAVKDETSREMKELRFLQVWMKALKMIS